MTLHATLLNCVSRARCDEGRAVQLAEVGCRNSAKLAVEDSHLMWACALACLLKWAKS